jgi:hypothetical protein
LKRALSLLMLLTATRTATIAADLVDHPQNLPRPQTPDAVVGDFNEDGIPDLVVLNIAPLSASCPCAGLTAIRVLLGNGDTTFTPLPEVPAGCDPRLMLAGDFTGDGHLDVATIDFGDHDTGGECLPWTLSLYRGDGAGGLLSLFSTVILDGELVDMAAGDVEGNGVLDIVGVSLLGRIMRFYNNPAGPQFWQTYASGFRTGFVSRVALGDVDGDGHVDVVVSKFWGGMDIYGGNGAGDFELRYTCARDGSAYDSGGGVLVANLDGVGLPEIVVVRRSQDALPPGFLDVFQRQTSNPDPFCPWNRRTLEVSGEIFTSVVAADFDGDGRLDLATSGSVPGSAPGQEATGIVRVFPNDGAGGFGPSTAVPIWESDHRLAVGDFNRDGRPDLGAVGRVNERTLAGHAHVLFNGVPAPPEVHVTMATAPDRVTWGDAGADSYDVLLGDLQALGTTGGRFDSATLACLGNDLTTLEAGTGPPDPPVGGGWFYLVRGNSAAGATWDSGGRGQIGRRDPEIAASPLACP